MASFALVDELQDHGGDGPVQTHTSWSLSTTVSHNSASALM
jgi:hypothetical protein